jgi:hypothetical protein
MATIGIESAVSGIKIQIHPMVSPSCNVDDIPALTANIPIPRMVVEDTKV